MFSDQRWDTLTDFPLILSVDRRYWCSASLSQHLCSHQFIPILTYCNSWIYPVKNNTPRWVTKETFVEKPVNLVFFHLLQYSVNTKQDKWQITQKPSKVLIFIIYITIKTWYFKITKQDYDEYYEYLLQLPASVCSDVQHFLQLIHFNS